MKRLTQKDTYVGIPFVAFVSGMTGLGYEIIYARLISFYIGDIFYIVATVLIAVFAGLAIGYRFSPRFVPHLWVIEALLALYAFITAFLFHTYGVAILPQIGGLLTYPEFLIAVSFFFIFLPMFLVGFSIPILSEYRHMQKGGYGGSFAEVYGLYALGAGVFVLILELLLIQTVGIVNILCIAGIVNALLALYLLYFVRSVGVKNPKKQTPVKWHWLLFTFGTVSAVFQFSYLEITFKMFSPHFFNFSIVLATALLGIGLGSYITQRYQPDFFSCTRKMLFVAIIPFLLLIELIYVWNYLYFILESLVALAVVKTLLIVGIGLPMFTLFGIVVPLYLREEKQGSVSGVLFSNVCGNILGIVLAVFVLFSLFGPREIIILVFIIIFLLVGRNPTPRSVLIVLCIALSLFFLWPQKEMYVGSNRPIDPKRLYELSDSISLKKNIRRFGSDTVVYEKYYEYEFGKEKVQVLTHNGYKTLEFSDDMKVKRRETVYGIIPAFYSKNHQQALVIGLGSGATPSGAADVYQHIKVFEINPAMLSASEYFSDINRNVVKRGDVEIVIQDGFIGTRQEKDKGYDAIILSVSAPSYYSAGKLFTKEYFEIVKQKLADGGVFSVWYDIRYSDEDIGVLYATLLSVFNECKNHFLNQGYFSLVCGQSLDDRYLKDIVPKSEFTKGLLSIASLLYLPIDMQTYSNTFPINSLNQMRIVMDGNRFHNIPTQQFWKDALTLIEDVSQKDPKKCQAYRKISGYHCNE